ncbi:hypothetical protein [Streptomyces sp. NPDC047070]|uniref:hypothetical protein n=1 Tax=Streptomyces sp. NPDC047070 TaxID=3154923 RepID=UPI0034516163
MLCNAPSYRATEHAIGGREMLEQALADLVAAGSTAVVQAAGTDAWAGLRQALARWFGRGNGQREQAELGRLDQTAAVLQSMDAAEAEQVQVQHEAAWRARIAVLLENLEEVERSQAADQLRVLLAQHAPQKHVSAGLGGVSASRNVEIRAGGNSIAAGVIHGGAHLNSPPMPDPPQG